MLRSVRTALYLSTSVLVFSGYLALGTTLEYGVSILLLPVLLFTLVPAAEWLDSRFPSYRRVTVLVTLCYTLSVPLLVFTFGLFSAVVGLVIYIQAHKLLHVKESRDYYHIFLMSFFLLVSACVLSPDASISLAILCFLASAVWSFFSLQVINEASLSPVVAETDIVPLHVRGSYEPPAPRRRRFDLSMFVSSVAITAACVLMTVTFFVATPRMEAGVLGGRSLQRTQTVTGLSPSVDLSMSGEIQRDTAPVMRVQTPREPNGQYTGELFWRSTTLDNFNGSGWEHRAALNRYDDFRDRSSQIAFVNAGPGSLDRRTNENSRMVYQLIYLDRVPDQGLPALPLPVRVEAQGARIRWSEKEDYSVRLVENDKESLLYEVTSDVYQPTPDQLRASSTDYRSELRANYPRLVDDQLSEKTRLLVREIVEEAGATNPYDKVKAIEEYLSKGDFIYSLNSPDLSSLSSASSNPVETFIQVSKIGHCEFFASAMALMVRSLGIPTRVVTGYRGGDWNPSDKSYTIRADMAHLWVEVYFTGYGWIPFDPSPPVGDVPASVKSRLEHALYTQLLKGKMFWYRHVVGYTNDLGLSGLHNITTGLFSLLSGNVADRMSAVGSNRDRMRWYEALPSGGKAGVVLFFTAFLAIFLGVLVNRSRTAAAGIKRLVLTRDQLRAISLFRRIKRRLQRSGTGTEGKTAEEVLEAWRDRALPNPDVVDRLVQAYNQVRFGGRPLETGQYEELRKLTRELT